MYKNKNGRKSKALCSGFEAFQGSCILALRKLTDDTKRAFKVLQKHKRQNSFRLVGPKLGLIFFFLKGQKIISLHLSSL